MNTEIETAIKEYYELNKKIKEIENRKSELKEVLYSALDSEHTNELNTEDILFYRVNRPRISWDESILKSILLPKGLWDIVLSVDNKKVRDLIESQILSWQEVEKAKTTVDTWYTYAERVSKNQEIKPSIYLIPDEEIKGIKRLVITDLSRMKEGRVCIFGFDEDRRHIRPVIPYTGINESYIFNEEGQRIIKPFAEVEFEFIRPMPEPPHTEDCAINTNYKPKLIRTLSENESKKFLEEILDESVKAIFGAAIHDNRYIKTGGIRSIGTIKVKEILSVNYTIKSIKENDKYNYRMTFSDMSGDVYNLPITDCAFKKYCDNQRIQKGKTTDVICHELQRILNQSEVFLRVGLTRLYKDVYWLQVSGVHAFPDYREKYHEKRVSEPFDKQTKDTPEDIDFKNTVSVLLNDFSGSKRAHAAYLLGESRNPMVVEILCNATKDSDVNVRRLAASALGKMRANRATDALIGLLYDHNPQVRQYAVKALGEIGDEKALPELMKFEDDAIPYIKKAIDTAIEKIKKSRADLDNFKKHKIEPKAINALGYTPNTERLDGMSKRDRIETLKQIIREFQHDKEAAPLEDIISKAESSGIERDAVEDVIRLLKRTGEIYEVSNEQFRIA